MTQYTDRDQSCVLLSAARYGVNNDICRFLDNDLNKFGRFERYITCHRSCSTGIFDDAHLKSNLKLTLKPQN